MNTRNLSLAALIVLCVAASPAAAISPGITVPASTTSSVSSGSGELDTEVDDGHAPAEVTRTRADCRAMHRGFVSRNTVQPSVRRQAIEACDETLASAKPSN
jgi:hypothetical protein